MIALQRRILFELEFGRQIECVDEKTYKWLDKRPKPPLEKRVIKVMLANGSVTKTRGNVLAITGAGRNMLVGR